MLITNITILLALVCCAAISVLADDNPDLGPAAASGQTATVRQLLDAGANVNAHIYGDNICGSWYLPRATALMVAVSCNRSIELVRLLIDRGAQMNYTTNYDYTALILAAANNNGRMLTLLLDRGAPLEAAYSALMAAADMGINDMVNLLLDRGVNVNGRDNSDRTPLIYAAKRGHTDTCRLLLERGADINAVTIWAMTPLSWAAFNNQAETVRFLLSKGASKKFCVYPMCSLGKGEME